MNYIDEKYVEKLGFLLSGFSKTGENVWNFRCPLCGDSKKNRTKKRGYIYGKSNYDTYSFFCHNCQCSYGFSRFLELVDSNIYQEYVFEKFGNKKEEIKPIEQNHSISKAIPKFTKNDLPGQKLSDLNDEHPAKEYIINRKIPKKYWNTLYYSNMKSWVFYTLGKEKTNNYGIESRIIIPFFDEDNNLIGFQGRALNKGMKYITCMLQDNSKIYGLNMWNPDKKTYILESPFDSMFVNNSLAVGGLSIPEKYLQKLIPENTVFVFDNEPRNKFVVNRMIQVVGSEFSIVIWPSNIKQKDVNEMIISKIDVINIFENYEYSGIRAIAKINDWKRI